MWSLRLTVCWMLFAAASPIAAEQPLLEGWVRMRSGEPVANAQVVLFDVANLRPGVVAHATTDAAGYFALPISTRPGSVRPQQFTLGPNYPNPFNPSTNIPYQLAASSQVRLEVFNLLGQHIATLVDGERPAGFHTATWTATDAAGRAVAAGMYIYRMTVGVESQTGRMVLLDGQAGISAGGAASVMPGVSGVSRSDGAGAQVYGLVVSGEGLAPYVDSSFRVEAGMAPVELVVSSGHWGGEAVDDDCAFCDLFELNDDEEGPFPSGKAQATLEVPAAPTNLRFDAPTDSSCTVRWDAAEGATDYDVNYKRAVGGKWTNKPHRGTGLYTTINDLEPGTEYRWAVRAENSDGPSEWVFGQNFTTLGEETGETEEGEDETPEEESTNGVSPSDEPQISLGGSVVSTLSEGEIEYFRIVADQSMTLVAYTTGPTNTNGAILDGSRSVLVSDDDSGESRNFSVSTPVSSGTYYVRVRGYSGSYRLYVTGLLAPSLPDESGASNISLGSTISTLSEGETEYFRIVVDQPMTLVAYATGPRINGAILDKFGSVLVDGRANHPGSVSAPVSPGTYYVRVNGYQSWYSGSYTLHVLGRPTPINLTNHRRDDRGQAWSPDGRRLAFDSYRDGNWEIYVMDSDGQNPTRLTFNNSPDVNPVWSPDGRHIAFDSYRDGNWEIHVMDSDGQNPTRLTFNNSPDVNPVWSPDGRHIAFDSYRDGNWEIYVMDSDGQNPTRLTFNDGTDAYPVWSPDGRRLAFDSTWEPGGHRFLFDSERSKHREIYVMDSDGQNPTRLTFDRRGYASGWGSGRPVWSPDGRRLAFESSRSSSYWIVADYQGRTVSLLLGEIYVMDSDGQNLTRLTFDDSDDEFPVWSPDGRRLAFRSERDGNWEIYVMDSDGQNLTRLTFNHHDDEFPVWSPDGRRLAFRSYRGGDGGNWEIYVMDVD